MLAALLKTTLGDAVQTAGSRHAVVALFATKASKKAAAAKSEDTGDVLSVQVDTSKLPSTVQGIAFGGDLRSTSGLGVGDGITNHTAKWMQGGGKSPMQYITEAEPIKVKGLVVASYGTDDPLLGCPVEYIDLKGTTKEEPAVCKYTGNRYYSDDWLHGGAH